MTTEDTPARDHVLVLVDWPAESAAADVQQECMEAFSERVGKDRVVLAQLLTPSGAGGFNAVAILELSPELGGLLGQLGDEGWVVERHDLMADWWDGREGKWRGGTNPLLVAGG